MPIRPRERFLARVIVVQLVVGIGAAVLPAAAEPVMAAIRSLAPGESSEDAVPPPRVAVPSTASSTTAPPPEPAAPSEVETVVVTEPPTTSPATTTTISATTTTTAPMMVRPAAVGAYQYRSEIDSRGESKRKEETLVVEASRDRDDETRRVHRRPDSSTREEHLVWRDDGVYLEAVRSVSDFTETDVMCQCDPPILLFPSPLGVGSAWSEEGTCVYDEGGENGLTVTVIRNRAWRVTDLEPVVVGGERIEALVLERSWDNREEGTGSVGESVEWVAPTAGLSVRVESHSERYEDGEQVSATRRTTELISLVPE